MLNGNQLDAQLAVSIPLHGTKTHQLFWVPADGAWKLSNASASDRYSGRRHRLHRLTACTV